MKKALGFSILVAILLAFQVALIHANSSSMGIPGASGRPQADGTTNVRTQEVYERGISDCSAAHAATATNTSSTAVSLSQTAALGWTKNSYAGEYILKVYNSGTYDMLVYVNKSSSSLYADGTNPAGDLIKAGNSLGITLHIHASDSTYAHFLGTTGTAAFNYMVCTN